MILETAKNTNLIKGNSLETKTVSIETSPAAVKIMTENLYSDVPLAVVRELCTNAIDANRKAGKPENDFIIHFPTKTESYFSVEDHGIGMTKEEVMYVYTTFFKSTNSSNNDNTGMYGLGSKAPLAYIKTFAIVSCRDGISNSFVETWEDGKMPEISLISTSKQTNSGTKITVPIKEEDFDSFNEAILKVCFFFKALPKFENDIDVTKLLNYAYDKRQNLSFQDIFDDYELLIEDFNNTYPTFSKLNYYNLLPERIYLEMGNVGYPIQLTSFYSEHSEMWELFKDLSKRKDVFSKLIIHANIGDVDIPPSRESVQLSKKTTKYIKSWIISFVANNYLNFDDINRRFQFYGSCHELQYLDLIYRNKEFIFHNIQDNFTKFYGNYENDKQIILQSFSDSSFLTHTPIDELSYQNKLLPYPYISNLKNDYFKYSEKPLRVVYLDTLPKKPSKSSTGNILGTYIRSHIRNYDNYKDFNYLFTDTETTKMLDSYGIEYKVLDNFNNDSINNKISWSNNFLFEVASKPQGSHEIAIEKTLKSWDNIKDLLEIENLRIIPLMKNREGYHILYGKNFNEAILFPSPKYFKYICEKVLSFVENGIIISGNAKDMAKLIPELEDYDVVDYIELVKSNMVDFINEVELLPVPEKNNFFRKLKNLNLTSYAESYDWQEDSNFKKAMSLDSFNEDDRFTQRIYWLRDGEGSFNYRLFLNLKITGLEDLADRLKNILDKNYKNNIGKLLDNYPLLHTNSICFYTTANGLDTDYVGINDKVKALIDYFAFVDGAKKLDT